MLWRWWGCLWELAVEFPLDFSPLERKWAISLSWSGKAGITAADISHVALQIGMGRSVKVGAFISSWLCTDQSGTA